MAGCRLSLPCRRWGDPSIPLRGIARLRDSAGVLELYFFTGLSNPKIGPAPEHLGHSLPLFQGTELTLWQLSITERGLIMPITIKRPTQELPK